MTTVPLTSDTELVEHLATLQKLAKVLAAELDDVTAQVADRQPSPSSRRRWRFGH